MSTLIVIEGDNGTGKDSLALHLQSLGFEIVTYAIDIKKYEMAARALSGEERLLAFLGYNKQCGLKAISSANPSLLVRYWISTIAAAYADKCWSWEMAEEKIEYCLKEHPVPNLVVKLECDLLLRTNRIEIRGTGTGDDMCLERDNRYRWALNKIETYLPEWENVNTSQLTIVQVFQVVTSILKKRQLA